jgi:Leucine-rich repeat (LRR) protein
LNALQKFDLLGWFNLKKLPSSIGQLNALQKLDLNGCYNLKELPSSIGQLNALQKLDSFFLVSFGMAFWMFLNDDNNYNRR